MQRNKVHRSALCSVFVNVRKQDAVRAIGASSCKRVRNTVRSNDYTSPCLWKIGLKLCVNYATEIAGQYVTRDVNQQKMESG